jgi:hypothetical protein
MLTLASIVALILYAHVVSQPFFYALALSEASTALSASAYVELRQRINKAIAKPLVQVYATAFIATVVTSGLALRVHAWFFALCTALAAIALALDLVVAVKRNVPINERMNAWNAEDVPPEWAQERAAWNEAFTVRQVILLIGFGLLAVGVSVH